MGGGIGLAAGASSEDQADTSHICWINQLSQAHGPEMRGELKTTGVTEQEIAHIFPLHHFGKGERGGADIHCHAEDNQRFCARTSGSNSSSSQTSNIKPTEMKPHPKHHSQMGHPAPLLLVPFGWAPLLLTPHHCRERPTTAG